MAALAGDGSRDVRLSAVQLRINQRISQAAVFRANRLTAMLDGRLEPVEPPRRDPAARLAVNVRQLLINQRISQSAVRRVNALAGRVPDLPVPRPPVGAAPVRITVATALGAYRVRVDTVARGPVSEGTELALALPSHLLEHPPGRGQQLAVDGTVLGGVLYPFSISVYDLEA